ncbi:unnamed protein product [Staurois parvus]|uniref:Uncharacterized protein n=1 Tax=Staurois parvus TaxID=386267 RepID=A0ABN9FXH7_9NEOB|nr:unnamed protein product [Staurois parvus]
MEILFNPSEEAPIEVLLLCYFHEQPGRLCEMVAVPSLLHFCITLAPVF